MPITKVTFSMIEGMPLNVNDFGAVGDGVANDSAAITAALQEGIDTGRPVAFSAGSTYMVNVNQVQVSIPDDGTLTIFGNDALIKQLTANTTPGNSFNLLTVESDTALTTTTTLNVYNLNFDASVQPQNWTGASGIGSNAITAKVGKVNIDNCKAENFFFSSVFKFLTCWYVNVTNCYMKNVGGHTPLDDAASSAGDAVQFYDIPNGAVYRVTNSTFIGYPTTPYAGGYAHNLSRAGVVFELGNGVTPAFSGFVDNCYFDGFSIVVHVELTAYADINVSNVTAINGWALIGGFGQYFKVRADNCSWRPLVSGDYNGINGFSMTDIGASEYTIDVYNSYYEPVSANRMDGTYYNCTFADFSKDNFQCGGSTKAFYSCTFKDVIGGPSSDYLFFGDTFTIFDNCTFNGFNAGSGADYKLSFSTRGTTQLRLQNCVFNDCGVYVDGDATAETIIDGCKFLYTAPISSLTIIDSGVQIIKIYNSDIRAAAASNNTKLNNSVSLSLVELVNSYVRNATAYTSYAQAFRMLGTTIEFDTAATPTAQGFYGRFSDYVVMSACQFVSPTASAITLATPDLRNSSITKINGTVSPLANI